jgi:hypothetical protein
VTDSLACGSGLRDKRRSVRRNVSVPDAFEGIPMRLVALLAGASAMEAEHYRAYAASMPAARAAQANASGARAVGPKGLLRPISALCAGTGEPAGGPQVRRDDIGEYDVPGGGSHALQRDTSTTTRNAPKSTRKMCASSVSSSGACPVRPLGGKVKDACGSYTIVCRGWSLCWLMLYGPLEGLMSWSKHKRAESRSHGLTSSHKDLFALGETLCTR